MSPISEWKGESNMDKQKIDLYQRKLFLELSIISILYNNKNQISLSQINEALDKSVYTPSFTDLALEKLVSYGIITVVLCDKSKILYGISEFGRYFFEKLLQENSNIIDFFW